MHIVTSESLTHIDLAGTFAAQQFTYTMTLHHLEEPSEQTNQLVHMQNVLTYHEGMLGDAVRNAAFQKALKKHVRPGMSVLDIGSGSGLWAIAAAKLGARRVVAIEREQILIPVIEKLISQNGVADRVEVLIGDSRDLSIKGKFDIIISETIGNEAFDEDIVPIMIDARRRFLKKDGVIIPQSVAAVLAPAHMKRNAGKLPAGVTLAFQYLELLSYDLPRRIHNPENLTMLGAPRVLLKVDLQTVKTSPNLSDLTATWRLPDASQLNCLVLTAEMELTKGIKLKTITSAAWTPIAFLVEPIAPGPAKIECRFTLSEKQYYWTVNATKNGNQQSQSHSPVYPFDSLTTKA